MRKLVLFLVALALVTAASASVFRIPTGQSPLQQKLENIFSLIPFDKVSGIVEGYVENNDPEILELVDYVESGKLQNLLITIITMPQVQHQLHELETKGIRVEEMLTYFKALILEKLPAKVEKIKPTSKGLMGMYTQILSTIPINQILGDVIVLAITNEELQIILQQVRSKECFEAAQEVLQRADVRNDLKRLQCAGLDVDEFIDTMERLLGWSSYRRHLDNKNIL